MSVILQSTGLDVLLGGSQGASQSGSTASDVGSGHASSRDASQSLSHQGAPQNLQLATRSSDTAMSVTHLTGVVIHGNVEAVRLEVTQSQIQLMQSLAAGWLQMVVAVWQLSSLLTELPLIPAPGHVRLPSGQSSGRLQQITAHYDEIVSTETVCLFSSSPYTSASLV